MAKTKNPIIKAIEKYDEELDSEMLFEQASKANSLRGLPEEVQEQFKLSDCIVEYEFEQEQFDETLEYLRELIQQIENDENYKPIKIDKSTEFFCNMLCRHRFECEHIKEYRKNFKEKGNILDNLFG